MLLHSTTESEIRNSFISPTNVEICASKELKDSSIYKQL